MATQERPTRSSSRAGLISIFKDDPGPKSLEQICSALNLSAKGPYIKSLVQAIMMFSSYRKPYLNAIGLAQPRLSDGNWDPTFTANVEAFLDICASKPFFPVTLEEAWRHDYWTAPGSHLQWKSASDRPIILKAMYLMFEYLKDNDHGFDLSEIMPLQEMIQDACDVCGGGHVGDNEVFECDGCELYYHPECSGVSPPVPPSTVIMCSLCMTVNAAKVLQKRERAAAKLLAEEEEDRAATSATNTPEKPVGSASKPKPKRKSTFKRPSLGLDKEDTKYTREQDGNAVELDGKVGNSRARSVSINNVERNRLRTDDRWGKVAKTKPKRRESSAAQGLLPFTSVGPMISPLASPLVSTFAEATAQTSTPPLPFRAAFQEAKAGYKVEHSKRDENIHSRNLSASAIANNGATVKKRSGDSESPTKEPDSKRRAGAVYNGVNPVNRSSQEYQPPSQNAQTSRFGIDPELSESPRDQCDTPVFSGFRNAADGEAAVKIRPVDPEVEARLLRLLQTPKFINTQTTLKLKDAGLSDEQINGTSLLLTRTGNSDGYLKVELSTITDYRSLFQVCGSHCLDLLGDRVTRLCVEVPSQKIWYELDKDNQRDFEGFIKSVKSKWDADTKSGVLYLFAKCEGEV